jgi:hypothetical protein
MSADVNRWTARDRVMLANAELALSIGGQGQYLLHLQTIPYRASIVTEMTVSDLLELYRFLGEELRRATSADVQLDVDDLPY